MHTVLFVVSFAFSVSSAKATNPSLREFDPDVDLSSPQIIRRHGYPSEAHIVLTDDGYLLTLHRIPHGRTSNFNNGRVVFLQHGLMSSSSDWIINGPGKSLAFLLADIGYDVWMGNCRGNTYSDGHISLSKKQMEYWNYTWHEMALYDLPAAIDFILSKTNVDKLFYVGHSMGTTMYFVMASMRPEYGLKVKTMFALAPIAYVTHMKSPIRLLATWADDLEFIAMHMGLGAFLPTSKIMRAITTYGCEILTWQREICSSLIFVLTGFDRPQFNMTLLPTILHHTPAGTSTKTIIHYAQEVKFGKFQQFDYGEFQNIMIYGSPDPPEYDLSTIQTPISLHYSDNDWLASIIDVEHLYAKLPRTIGKFLIEYPGFNHIDFLYGIDAKPLVYDRIIQMMDKM